MQAPILGPTVTHFGQNRRMVRSLEQPTVYVFAEQIKEGQRLDCFGQQRGTHCLQCICLLRVAMTTVLFCSTKDLSRLFHVKYTRPRIFRNGQTLDPLRRLVASFGTNDRKFTEENISANGQLRDSSLVFLFRIQRSESDSHGKRSPFLLSPDLEPS